MTSAMTNVMTLTEWATFFGWCTVINLVIYSFSAVVMLVFKSPIQTLHARWFPLSESELEAQYFNFLGNYKLAIFVFNLVPYLALKLMM